jgi:photosystem II stability/assembly factor-like uncharacterized protein
MSLRRLVTVFIGLAVISSTAWAQPFDQKTYDCLRWRMIGPHRGGRTVGATGVPGQPNVFYIGVNNGGVWKTTDAGRTWRPIFDDQPTGSIGALAVAPSNPDIIYVGSGEGLQRPDLSTGDGMYKSVDGGKTWKHLGLSDGQQIAAVIVDPRNPDRVFVAVLGHPYGANEERGIFRSTNGGRTWDKVLYKDENTGASALAFDPSKPETIYGVLWSARQGPWENGRWQGPGSGLFKSTDGGTTWLPLTKGLPTAKQGLGRIGIGIAPSNPRRVYALVEATQSGGLYRSDNAGEDWRLVNTEQRVWGRGDDFAEVKVDPKNPDIIYVANTSAYRSADAGQNFTGFKGAPGGDDYHTFWINPDHPDIILLASDQGAIVTVNGGQTWSSWYNQPTAQFYHVSTDNQFPYWVYGGQQESGSAGVVSRGPFGQINGRDWQPVGGFEYDYIAPDPLHPNLIYAGHVTRFDRTTGQVENVGPEAISSGKYRFLRTAPLLFSPVDPHILYLGSNVVFKTTDGGMHWDIISPDLTREKPEVPDNIGVFRTEALARQPRRGVVYTVAPSYQDVKVIWAGTDDGLIHHTADGGATWKDVTPPGVTSWSKISLMDAGRFDPATAYAAVNRIRLDDQRPHIYRTHDAGKTWQEIVRGLPAGPVNVVREDPVRRGLLFCGTERAVFVSFNDGDDWQPLRLNMPATSIRDLVIKDDDVVVGTHGRSFWILDDITPLRQINHEVTTAAATLYQPQLAYRVRWNVNTDTPIPPDEPAGQNPPDGAILNYYLKSAAAGPVTLEIRDAQNKLVRRYASTDQPPPVDEKRLDIPTYWIRPPQPLGTAAGSHRFVWDLHYPPPPGSSRQRYPMTAVYRDTPSEPHGPWAMPGTYSVQLIVDGKTYTQPLTLRMDPRVRTPLAELQRQFDLSMAAYEGIRQAHDTLTQVRGLRGQVKERRAGTPQESVDKALQALDEKLAALEGRAGGFGFGGRRGGGGGNPSSLSAMSGQLERVLALLQRADTPPTPLAEAACHQARKSMDDLLKGWSKLKETEVRTTNELLQKHELPKLDASR